MDLPSLFEYHFHLLTHLHDRFLRPHVKFMDVHATYNERKLASNRNGDHRESEKATYAILSRVMVVVGTALER